VILPSLANPFYHKFLDGVDEIARKAGSMVFVCSSREDPDQAFRYLSQLAAKHVDGIILASQDLGVILPQVRPEHEQMALPIVTVDWPGADRDCVLLDLENAGYLATRHLVEHGHRRIGLLTFNKEASNVTQINNGYEKALREAKIEPDPHLVIRVNGFDMGSGEAGMHEFLTREACPSAFFAISDTLALGAMKALRAQGLHIPTDIALASFNDIDFAELVDPPLTTVSVPVRDMGMKAMQMLQGMIAGSKPTGRKVVLPASLVIRESCGCKRTG
jgi:DNA-binding LacI/PurR family transcriptional regulator